MMVFKGSLKSCKRLPRFWVRIGIITGLAVLTACAGNSEVKSDSVVPLKALAPCPNRPLCVSSDTPNAKQRMAPIEYRSSRKDAQQRLRRIVERIPRAYVVVDVPGYLAVSFTSPIMRFVDDAEFLFDNDKQIIHFRSSARIGYYDFKVNRLRMENIVQAFQASR